MKRKTMIFTKGKLLSCTCEMVLLVALGCWSLPLGKMGVPLFSLELSQLAFILATGLSTGKCSPCPLTPSFCWCSWAEGCRSTVNCELSLFPVSVFVFHNREENHCCAVHIKSRY